MYKIEKDKAENKPHPRQLRVAEPSSSEASFILFFHSFLFRSLVFHAITSRSRFFYFFLWYVAAVFKDPASKQHFLSFFFCTL